MNDVNKKRASIINWPTDLPQNPLDWPAKETVWIDIKQTTPWPELEFLAILAFPDKPERGVHFTRCYASIVFRKLLKEKAIKPEGIEWEWWHVKYRKIRLERLFSGINQAFRRIEKRFMALEAFEKRMLYESFGNNGWLIQRPKFTIEGNKLASLKLIFDPPPSTIKGGFRELFKDKKSSATLDGKGDIDENAVDHAMTRIWSESKPVLHLVFGLNNIMEPDDWKHNPLPLIKRGGMGARSYASS